MTTQKSRKNPRAPVTLLARYRSPTAFEYVEERCFDLSSGGMFIESNTPAPAGTLIKLECDINQGAGTLRGVARVVWLREQESDGQPRGMGVKFLKLEPGSRELIMQLLGERASLPPSESIPPSRRSWAGSVAPQPRTSGVPAAGTSHAPSRPSVSAQADAAPPAVSMRPEVDASELSEVVSARPRAASPEPAAAHAPAAANEAVSDAIGADAAVTTPSALVPMPPAEPALSAPATHAATAGGGAEPAAATAHAALHDHRPHAHELRERLARRAAAQRAAAAGGASAATTALEERAAAHSSAATAAAAPAATAAAPPTTPANTPQPAVTDAKQGWTEPARAVEPEKPAAAATAARAPAAAAATSAAASGPATPAHGMTDERREFTLKGDVPVEEMAKGRGVIYLGLIAACVALILVLQLKSSPEPETPAPAAPAAEPAALAAPVVLPPAVEPAPAAAPQPVEAPTTAPPPYVLEVSTTPEGATVTVGSQSATTPAKLALGALEAPVTVRVQKEGFEPASVELDLAGFALEDGEHRRSMALSLTASAPPPPPPPPKVAAAKPEPPPKAPAAKPRAAARPPREPARPKPAAPVAIEPAAPKPEPAPAAPAQSPLEIATACLASGDNVCVLRALEGKANGPRELEMVVETHRAMGNGTKAEQLMQLYVEKYPTERRAVTYKRLLDRKLGASAAPAAGAAPAPAAPAPAEPAPAP